MINRKTIMFLALLGTYAAQAGEGMYLPKKTKYEGKAPRVSSPMQGVVITEGQWGEEPLPGLKASGRMGPSEEESTGTITYGTTEAPMYAAVQRPARGTKESITYGGIESSAQKQARINKEMTELGGVEQAYNEPEYVAPNPKQPRAKKSEKSGEKANIETSLKKAEQEGGSEQLCAVAARFGRTLKVLPKSKGPINKDKLAKKCGDYFLGKNDAGKMHPQAFAAVMNYKGKDVDAWAKEHASMRKIS